MNAKEKFIRDAGLHPSMAKNIWRVMLDPAAWQAVGKVRGWGSGCNICLKDRSLGYAGGFAEECKNPTEHLTEGHIHPWMRKMHSLIDALAEGKSIEDYLSTDL